MPNRHHRASLWPKRLCIGGTLGIGKIARWRHCATLVPGVHNTVSVILLCFPKRLSGMASATNAPFLTCLNCRKESADCKTCQSCKVATYCGRECQKASYKQHKETCVQLNLFGSKSNSLACPSGRIEDGKVFSWDFLRENLGDRRQSRSQLDFFQDRYATLLLKVGCMERNKNAFAKFLDFFWDRVFEGGFAVDYYQLRAVMMLLALGRVQEAENLVRFAHLELDDMEMKMPSREDVRKSNDETALLLRRTGDFSDTVAVVQNWFLYACVLASRLVAARKGAEAVENTIPSEAKSMGTKQSDVEVDGTKEFKQLEAEVKQILQLIHKFNEFLLPGIENPMTLGITPEMPDQFWQTFMKETDPDLVGSNTPAMRKKFANNFLRYILVLLQMAGGLDEEIKKLVAEFGILKPKNSARSHRKGR